MPDTPPNSEQEQFKQLLKRWRKINNLAAYFGCGYLSFFLVSILTILAMIRMRLPVPAAIIIIESVTFGAIVALFIYYLARRGTFLKSFTEEEKLLLDRTVQYASKRDKTTVAKIISAYEDSKGYTTKELLRASIEPQDDTLLRAVQYTTDTTPQDQLLRPDPSDENTRQ